MQAVNGRGEGANVENATDVGHLTYSFIYSIKPLMLRTTSLPTFVSMPSRKGGPGSQAKEIIKK